MQFYNLASIYVLTLLTIFVTNYVAIKEQWPLKDGFVTNSYYCMYISISVRVVFHFTRVCLHLQVCVALWQTTQLDMLDQQSRYAHRPLHGKAGIPSSPYMYVNTYIHSPINYYMEQQNIFRYVATVQQKCMMSTNFDKFPTIH